MKTICCRLLALFAWLPFPFSALANPLGGIVTPGSGAASIAGGAGVLTVNQTTPNVIISWNDFSIGAGELTRFVQPSSSAAALNRVITSNPSLLFGTLQANGQIFLINPNGIIVGAAGQINTSTFVGSTLDMGADIAKANASFLSGAGLTFSGSSTAGIENRGTISGLGDIFLIAHTVKNSGTISGQNVGLAAGTRVELKQAQATAPGAERISVIAEPSSSHASEGVNNAGTIAAVTAELKAAGGNIYALAINNGGAVRATKLVNEGGRIFLRAEGGTVVNSGVLDASAKGAGEKGGQVQVLGKRVGLLGKSVVDVSGDGGGGTVLVGGDFQGKNPTVPNAVRTVVDKNVTIKADAITTGNGGKDRKSTRLNSSHLRLSRMPSSA